MRLGSHLAEGLRPVIDLVYPPRCPLCGDAIAAQGGLCVDCWGDLEVPGDPSCKTCQRPMGSAAAAKSQTCYECATAPPLHSGIIAASIYNDASRKLILSYKHGGKIALAPLLGQLMASRIPLASGEQLPLLVPVPLHRWRLWRRGFNQAAMLARDIAKRGKGELIVDALIRRKQTPSLGGLGGDERKKALSGAIAIRPSRGEQVVGRDVILVDDVLTSGATSDACVTALLDAGAQSVQIACFARVVDGQGMGSSGRNRIQKSETPEAVTAPGAT